jgi:hypothetical protein
MCGILRSCRPRGSWVNAGKLAERDKLLAGAAVAGAAVAGVAVVGAAAEDNSHQDTADGSSHSCLK